MAEPKINFTFQIMPEVDQKLRDLAKQSNVSKAEIVRRAIDFYLENQVSH